MPVKVPTAAAVLSCTPQTVRDRFEAGELAGVKIGKEIFIFLDFKGMREEAKRQADDRRARRQQKQLAEREEKQRLRETPAGRRSALERTIADLERQVSELPGQIAQAEQREKNAAIEAARAGLCADEDPGVGTPSQGMRSWKGVAQLELRQARGRLAALLEAEEQDRAEREQLPQSVPSAIRERVARLRDEIEKLSKPLDGDMFAAAAALIKNKRGHTLRARQTELDGLLSHYPALVEPAQVDEEPEPLAAEQVVRAAIASSGDSAAPPYVAEPTVSCAVGAPDSPFPPSVQRGAP